MRYRMRAAGRTFLLAALAAVLTPASLPLATLVASLGAVTVVSRAGTVSKRALAAASTVAVVVGIYALRSRGSPAIAAGSALLAGFVAFAVLSRLRGRAELRVLALGEMFCYMSMAGVLLGVKAVDENRTFFTSTTGNERWSFVFASSASQAAMVAGATLILALIAPIQMRRSRRVALIGVASFIVYGANYRFVIVITAFVLVACWFTSIRKWPRRLLTPLAIGLLILPLWWPAVSAVVDGPAAAVVTRVPGLGSRNASQSDIEEARSLNQRTDVWSATVDLLGRSSTREVLMGYGRDGGDHVYDLQVLPIMSGDFERTDTISAHNTLLEIQRRAGVPFALLCFVLVVLVLERLRVSPYSGSYAVAASLVAYGSTDISSAPLASMPFFMLLAASLPALVPSRSRWIVGPPGSFQIPPKSLASDIHESSRP